MFYRRISKVSIPIKNFGVFSILCLTWVVMLPTVAAQSSSPNAINPSSFSLRLDSVGSMPKISGSNPTSPVAAGNSLLLVEQAGRVYRWDGQKAQILMSTDTPPVGINPIGSEKILNVASNEAGNKLYVVYTSSTPPAGIPTQTNPRAADRPGEQAWHVIYGYDFNGAAVSNPRPIAGFQIYQNGHTGGGLNVLSNGQLLFATGDNGDAGEDGRRFSQDGTSHLGKLLLVDPANGSFDVAAQGIRNAQRLVSVNSLGTNYIGFADIGGGLAEEINFVSTSDLLSTSVIENFGWGRNADSFAREGTFYINSAGNFSGIASQPESGFIQPYAQWGREELNFVAVSGPVQSNSSFVNLTSVFGDLASGKVLGTAAEIAAGNHSVYELELYDSSMQATSLNELAGGRADPRFFNFSDGTAGVLLERTGEFFRLTEIGAVPLPSSMTLLIAGIMAIGGSSLTRRPRAVSRG